MVSGELGAGRYEGEEKKKAGLRSALVFRHEEAKQVPVGEDLMAFRLVRVLLDA